MRIVVAMSGGVDSSVAALLLKKQGHEVIGISMKLRDQPEDPSVKTSGCCSVQDMNDARRVCDDLGISFYAMNFKEEFKEKVIHPFVTEYLKGRTPNPCVLCNSEIKFNPFLAKAKELGAEKLATGHYARIESDEAGNFKLLKGVDPKKDQSYFLYSLGQKELAQILFPLGGMTKEEVRKIAREHNLKTKDKAESQEICFVPNDDAGAFVEKAMRDLPPGLLDSTNPPSLLRVPNSRDLSSFVKRGDFVDTEGKILGQHEGIHHYTIGQRRGTQVAAGKRVYVKSIDPKTNQIILAEDLSLYQTALIASKVHWTQKPPASTEKISAKIRYRHQAENCFVERLGNDQTRVTFEDPQRAITPGQAIVFYQQDEVLGGGWIEEGIQ